MKLLWFAALLLLVPVDLLAQPESARLQPGLQLPTADSLAFAQRPADPGGSRDSLGNGALIGAIVGGAAVAVMTTYLCVAVGEEGDPPCWRGVLVVSALGAGVGAAAGAGIDAMFMRAPSAPAPGRGRLDGRRLALTWRQRF